jgi:rhodanese-related sulfurtransferase
MVDQVRPSDLTAWLQAQPRTGLVLDVRGPAEVKFSSIRPAGFELLVIPMNDIPARLAELDPARPVAVLCHRGSRSDRVAKYLASNGFATVANIAGGIDAWSLERDPSVPRY